MAQSKNNFLLDGIQDPIFENVRLFITGPSREEAETYGLYMDAEDQNESYFLPLAKKYNLPELFNHLKSGRLHHHNEWKEAALALSNKIITKYLTKFFKKK
jgi:hypothetical protein